jgi:hypothetical protein
MQRLQAQVLAQASGWGRESFSWDGCVPLFRLFRYFGWTLKNRYATNRIGFQWRQANKTGCHNRRASNPGFDIILQASLIKFQTITGPSQR